MAHQRLIWTLIFAIATTFCLAQTDSIKKQWPDSVRWKKTNTFFIEAGGYSLISPTYDKIIYIKQSLKLSARVGFSVLPGNKHKGYDTYYYIFPVGLNAFWGNGKHHFQTGIGETYVNGYEYPKVNPQQETENINIFDTNLFLGYRYQKPTGGLFFQGGLIIPVLEIKRNTVYTVGQLAPLGAGIGIGYSFLQKHFR